MSRNYRVWTFVAVLGTSIASSGCGHGSESGGARDVGLTSAKARKDRKAGKNAPITQAELQQDIQRFASGFLDRIVQAMGELAKGGTPEVSDAALVGMLRYTSAALDIATGPLPEVNLLDMLVFVRLSGKSFEEHWMPELYGERGRATLEAFQASDEALQHIASRILSPEQRTRLEALIEQWRQDNPMQYRVESVRLMDFSVRAGQVEIARAKEAGGLLASVKGATQAADQALLLAERGLFLANRVPFLVRLQARVGTREITSDALARLGSPSQFMTELEPMVQQLPVIAERSGQAAREARFLVHDVQPLIPSRETAEKINETITKTNDLTVNTRQMLEAVKGIMPRDTNQTVSIAKRGVDATLTKGLVYLALLGGVWSALWWGGYYLVKRRLVRRAEPARATAS